MLALHTPNAHAPNAHAPNARRAKRAPQTPQTHYVEVLETMYIHGASAAFSFLYKVGGWLAGWMVGWSTGEVGPGALYRLVGLHVTSFLPPTPNPLATD
jgi:hypothetical protein